jgi:diguanylate cyclase (GGDEF)-like protein
MPSWWSRSPNVPDEEDVGGVVRRFVEASRRAEIIALVNSARTDREVAHVIVDELCEALEAEVAVVVVTRPDRTDGETIGHVGLAPAQVAAAASDPLIRTALTNARAHTHAGEDLLGVGARQVVLSPWTAENGRRVVIAVARLYDEGFDAAELSLLEAVTKSVGHGLERAWLGAERDRHAARQAALARAASSLAASLVADDVVATLSAEVARALEADLVMIYGRDQAGELGVLAAEGLDATTPLPNVAADDAARLAGLVREGAPRVWQPAERRPAVGLPSWTQLRAGVAAPIRAHGNLEGVILAGYRSQRWVEREDVALLCALADVSGIAWGNAADHAAAQEAAALDSLTGCLNHGAFQDRLREETARARRGHGSLSLAIIDLNDFKAVNDTLGHQAGDALLRGVAEALRASVRPYDQVARYGGDEFALLLPGTDEEGARCVMDRALRAIAGVRVPGQAPVNAAGGLAHWRGEEAANSLIARADRSLLEAKRARGRGRRGEAVSHGEHEQVAQREGQRLRRLATAGSLGTRLARLLDQRAIAETAIVELGAALGYDRCMLVRRAPGGDVSVVATAREPQPGGGQVPEVSEALRRALRERRTVLVTLPDGQGGPSSSELAVPVFVGGALWGAMAVCASAGTSFDDDDAQLVQSVADHLGTALRTAELYEQLDRTHLGTAEALAAALEAKDHYTADHARSIADLAVAVGRVVELDDEALRDLRYGAIFHDIGKIAIPDAILKKPGPLTEAELDVVRRHPAAGEQILVPVPFLSGVRRIVRHDHERWDGAGYPDGLRGDEIPIGARIVLVVDAYHAMRSDRPYRPAMRPEAARAELRRHAGTQFDPRIVDALLDVLDRDPATEPA